MNYKMMDLKGIDQDLVAKLKGAGVETTSDMMKVWLDRDRRTQVESSSGLSEEQFQRMVSMARVARMPGVGPKYAEILVTAGVIGRKSLAKHTPETLVKHLAQLRESQTITGPMPTPAEVGAWFENVLPPEGSRS
ncbi:MAG TPA: DUF4332 domain-containing protein [Acidobacteriota bacterium]|nr:DUF4332 domain-containing protein [Acidobacteriota bacterium]